jgi:dihydroxy-acid dehydratase
MYSSHIDSSPYGNDNVLQVGGTPAILKYLLERNFIDGSCRTVTTKTLAENLAVCPSLTAGQDVVLPIEKAIKSSGHIQILYGNLAPEGSGELHLYPVIFLRFFYFALCVGIN